MTLAEQRRLIEYAKDKIAPYNPADPDRMRKKVYAHLIEAPMNESEMTDEKLLLLLELFTPESINTAYGYFVDRNQDEDYIPERYTFAISGDTDSPEYQQAKALMHKMHNGWIKGTLREESSTGIKGHLSLSFGLVDKERNHIKMPLELDATFVPEELDMADENITNLFAVSEAAASIFPNADSLPDHLHGLEPAIDSDMPHTKYTVRVYRVEHGNTITIQDGDNCILFDCGHGKKLDTKVKNTIIDSVKPDIIIFSHWHIDHSNLLADINCSKLKLIVYPNQNNLGKQGQQTIYKLTTLFQNGVIPVDLSQLGTYNSDFLKNYGFERIDVFIGQGKQDPGVGSPLGHIGYDRSIDDNGAILSIKNWKSNKRAILPGDCSYYSWPDTPELDLLNTIKLVVPHHGGHAIKQNKTGYSPSFYTDIIVSTEKDIFYDRIEANSQTYHRSYVYSRMQSPHEHITHNQTGVYISFKI